MQINEDGSMQGESFTKTPDITYPTPKIGQETYRQYRKRVEELSKAGFHMGDLTWPDYEVYCKGSGMYDNFNADTII